jgi:TonB family protein
MMLHKESKSSHLLKLLALIPIVGIALALNARTVTHYVYDEPQKQQPVKKGKKAGTIKVNGQEIKVVEQDDIVTMEGEADRDLTPDIQKPESVEMPNGMAVDAQEKVFDVVEQMPEYPGGVQALLEYLQTNVRYPEEAEKQNLEGRVILTFVVGKDGSIRNAKVVKSVDPLLDAEALRVINAMPNWKPGRQNGKPVAVKYTVPLSFHLDDADTEGELVKSTGSDTSKPTAIHISGTTENLLIIVDGKEMSAEKMRRIDPKTIDRIEVLKDEDAIKRYGEKAKEGVILITTKKE